MSSFHLSKRDCFNTLKEIFPDEFLAILCQVKLTEPPGAKLDNILKQCSAIHEKADDERVFDPASRLDEVKLTVLSELAKRCDDLPQLAVQVLYEKKFAMVREIGAKVAEGTRIGIVVDALTSQFMDRFPVLIQKYRPFEKFPFDAWLSKVASNYFKKGGSLKYITNFESIQDDAYIELVIRQHEADLSIDPQSKSDSLSHVEHWIERIGKGIGLSEDSYELFRMSILKSPGQTWDSIAEELDLPNAEAARKKAKRIIDKARQWIDDQGFGPTAMLGISVILVLFSFVDSGIMVAEKSKKTRKRK